MDINLADGTVKLACWRPRLLEFEIDFVRKYDNKKEAVDALTRLHTASTDTTDMDDELLEMIESLVKLRGEQINDDHYRNSDLTLYFSAA